MTLSLTELTIARGGLPVLERVSLVLEPGQAIILRGPNGIGKTSLLRAVAGLQPVLSGRIEGAEDRVAYGAHADAIKATLSVSENLSFWAGIYGTGDIHPALVAYRLDALADRMAGALSAGQKRRLGLARLLVTGRPIWALDEPTVSLDSQAIGWFADAVRAHLGQGGSALIATHQDLGLQGDTLDLSAFRAELPVGRGGFDEAFL